MLVILWAFVWDAGRSNIVDYMSTNMTSRSRYMILQLYKKPGTVILGISVFRPLQNPWRPALMLLCLPKCPSIQSMRKNQGYEPWLSKPPQPNLGMYAIQNPLCHCKHTCRRSKSQSKEASCDVTDERVSLCLTKVRRTSISIRELL